MTTYWEPHTEFVPPITIDQIKAERSVGEFSELIERIHDAVGTDRDAQLWLRHSTNRAVKVFRDELIPLDAFLRAEKITDNIRLFVPSDGRPDDAILRSYRSDGSDQPLQITNSAWEYQDTLRMEVLTREGSVNAFNPIGRDKPSGIAERPSTDCVSRESIHSESIRRIVDRIRKKRIPKKNANATYDTATWLIAQMDDPLMTEEHRSVVCGAAAQASQGCTFERVYVVSPNEPVFSRKVWDRK